jgi:hypothetical protein
MASKNRKKKTVKNRKPPSSYIVVSKTYFEDYVKTAHKLMRLIGLQPSDFDALSKRTKQQMMKLRIAPIRVRAEKGDTVPRPYINLFNWMMGYYMKTTYYGDPSYNILRLEYFTYLQSLRFYITELDSEDKFLPTDQLEHLHRIKESLLKYEEENEREDFYINTNRLMRILFLYTSQPNYRYYTSKDTQEVNYLKAVFEYQVNVSTIEPERKIFYMNGNKRSSFRLGYYDLWDPDYSTVPIMAEIPQQILQEDNMEKEHSVSDSDATVILLPVFIQNHALHRFSERMDATDNYFRNISFSMTFKHPAVVTAINGQRLIKAIDDKLNCIGYYPFLEQNGSVLLLSFLPLASPITPEGSVLFNELGVLMEDSKYIGLDKLSFYIKTDFASVPKLEKALRKAGLWHLTDIQPKNQTERREYLLLKRYFEESKETYSAPV